MVKNHLKSRRLDIEGLRCLAVTLVLAGHFYPDLVPSGYLGVDVFFVISGFVITGLLFRMINEKPIALLVEFYSRRIRRLLPSLLVIVTVSLALSLLVISRVDGQIGNTAKWSLLGVSNYYLWHISNDYFGVLASQNPFTHTWSLAVEEQFYFLYPLIFLIAIGISVKRSKVYLLSILIFLSSLSLILSFALTKLHPELNFYSMPTRFWELALGGITFLLSKEISKIRTRTLLSFVAFATLLCTILSNFLPNTLSPVVTCALTALIIYSGPQNRISAILGNRLFTWVGGRSYSIYLVHWPVLVLGNYLLGDDPVINSFLLVISILLAAVNFKFIETPLRNAKPNLKAGKVLVVGILAVATLTTLFHFLTPKFSQSTARFLPGLFNISNIAPKPFNPCSGSMAVSKLADPFSSCLGGSKNSRKKYVYLIGDSHADQIVPTLNLAFDSRRFKVVNLNMESANDFPFHEMKANDVSKSLKYVAKNSKIGDLLVLAFHRGHLNPIRDAHISMRAVVSPTKEALNLQRNLNTYVRQLARSGIKVILVKDTPLMGSIQSAESCALNLKILGRNGCGVSMEQDNHTKYLQTSIFNFLVRQNQNTAAWDPSVSLFEKSNPFNVIDRNGNYLMWDWNHISMYTAVDLAGTFSEFVFKKFNLETS